MSQILRIFRKDLKHHWPEIAILLAVLVTYTWKEPSLRNPEEMIFAGAAGVLWRFLPQMLLLAWGLLIVRVVQGESLVGDRQFWVTRPYEWPKLLAAKVLFILALVNVPWFIAQMILLARAGFPPEAHVIGLIRLQLLISAILFLPAVTAAVVTSTVLQVCLVALGLGLYGIAAGSLGNEIPNSHMDSGASFVEPLTSALILGTCILAILWQYARRRTWQSRAALICLAAVMVIIDVATPYGRMIARAYPEPSNGQEPSAKFALLAPDNWDASFRSPGVAMIKLPLRVSGVASASVVGIKGIFVTVEDADGFRWESHWLPQYGLLWPDSTNWDAEFNLDKKIFDRVASVPVNAHISFALTSYHEEDERTVVVTREFSMQGMGNCALPQRWGISVSCRSPLTTPRLIATLEATQITCAPRPGMQAPTGQARATEGNWDAASDNVEPGIDPIVTFSFAFSSNTFSLSSNKMTTNPPIFWETCPGTPITLWTPRFEGRSRAELDVKSIRLGDYEQKLREN